MSGSEVVKRRKGRSRNKSVKESCTNGREAKQIVGSEQETDGELEENRGK